MRSRLSTIAIGMVVLLPAAQRASAAGQAMTAPAVGGVVVLDTAGAWRMHHVMRSPGMLADGNLLLIPSYEGRARLDWYDGYRKGFRDILAPQTATAPRDWKDPGFDDSEWVRGTAARAGRTPYLERLCLRGKFDVSDPAKVGKLSLEVDYHGGAVANVSKGFPKAAFQEDRQTMHDDCWTGAGAVYFGHVGTRVYDPADRTPRGWGRTSTCIPRGGSTPSAGTIAAT